MQVNEIERQLSLFVLVARLMDSIRLISRKITGQSKDERTIASNSSQESSKKKKRRRKLRRFPYEKITTLLAWHS